MNDIIQWLRNVERLAGEAYLQASLAFADDERFKKFLEHTAEDEAWHYHVMGSAADYVSHEPESVSAISVDKETKDKILLYFSEMKDGLAQKTLSRDELIEKIVEAELSEWNDIFLYVVRSLKNKSREFRYPAARMQAHIRGIVHYLQNVENKHQVLEKINNLPPVWIEKILIVDDQPMVSDLLKALFNREGDIDIAQNGKDALKLIEKKYYKLIISDIDMPLMDGISLFKTAAAKFPKINDRFLFLTGTLSPERQAFFTENNLKYLPKPVEIKKLRETASEIILSA